MSYDINFQATVFPALMAAFDDSLSSVYDGRLYHKVAPKNSISPRAIYQSQDGGGTRADTVDRNAWEGLITFRSISMSESNAWDLLLQLSQALSSVTASGYVIEYIPEHTFPMPTENITAGNVYTAALIVQFLVYKDTN